MAKKYLLHNVAGKNSFIIRNEFQKFLTRSKFIEDIYGDDETVVEEIKDDGEIVQKLKIDLSLSTNIKAIWRVNLEQEIDGISTKNYFRTPEIALLILTHQEGHSTSILHVVFIELKKSLQDSKEEGRTYKQSTLKSCEEKFTAAMNRMYMLLSLNEHNNDPNYSVSIILNFKGVICYINDNTTRNDNTQLYPILRLTARNNIIDCKTIFGDNDKMKVAFYNDTDIISLDRLLNI
ncbi:hypothetical protein ACE193_18775 [Bernardetia sp. OM2101]|uniref:hypothetical protein n=1 Tax=Bernardetia sp. OM2101 TaxID=3344876 RepID=UPI0035D0D81B